MLGQIDEWFFRSLAGIRQKPGTHGYRHLIIDPQSLEGIGRVKAIIHTLYGEVKMDFDPVKKTLNTSVPRGCTLEEPSFPRMKDQIGIGGLITLMAPTWSFKNNYYDNTNSESYDPQWPFIWFGSSWLTSGIMGHSYSGYHLRSGVFNKTEFGVTYFEVSKNLYRGIMGYAVGLQFVVNSYDLSLCHLAKRVGNDVEFEPQEEEFRNNHLDFYYMRIPFLIGVQTYGRQLSLQTGPAVYVGGSTYNYRLRGEDKSEKNHLHTQNFGAQWMVMAGIGPLTVTYTQQLVHFFRMSDCTKAYPCTSTCGS